MAWVAQPVEETEGARWYHEVQAQAVEWVEVLAIAADRLSDAAAEFSEDGDTGTIQLAIELRSIRESLIHVCRLHKPMLSREAVQLIRDDFAFVNMSGPEHAEAREALAMKVAGRPIEGLRELSPEEAVELRAEIQKLEEKF